MATHTAAANALSIDVSNIVLAPNGTGEVAVSLTGTGEAINLAGYEFRITPDEGTSSQLRFLEENEEFLLSPNYVFVGNSLAYADASPSSIGSVSTSSIPDDTFVGGDGTSDFSDVTANGKSLLVNLLVQHDVGPADPSTTLGHSFSLDLVPVSGDSLEFANGAANSGFVDTNFATVAFDSDSGTVTVVPEPTSLTLLALAGLVFVAARRSPIAEASSNELTESKKLRSVRPRWSAP